MSDPIRSQGASEKAGVGRLVEHLFRHQSARLVSLLTAVFGPGNLEMAEEVVQEALVTAMQKWPFHGIPEHPEAWLARVARNKALDRVRRRSNFHSKEQQIRVRLERLRPSPPSATFLEEVDEDQLRLMFMCCHPALSQAARLALTLKTVGGFSRDEIARAFLTRPATLAQRLVRAKRLIREARLELEMPQGEELSARLDSVHDVLYLIFNEGYGSHQGRELLRRGLCRESIRLASILTSHPLTSSPEGKALLALMLFQSARLPARTDSDGNVILLEDQDRSLWDRRLIGKGFACFSESITGFRRSRFHIEAAIAATHARAPSYRETDWRQILALYDDLAEDYPSPVVELNRAVALAFVEGPRAALRRLLSEGVRKSEITGYYLYPATLARLHSELDEEEEAARCYREALEMPCSEPEKRLLSERLQKVGGNPKSETPSPR